MFELSLVHMITINKFNKYRHGNSCEVGAIQTSKNTLHSKKAVVIAAGCWTGSLMHDLIKQPDIELDLPIKPRKVLDKM